MAKPQRCAVCYKRLDVDHMLLGRCTSAVPKRSRKSRANRVPRDQYLESIKRSPEEKRAAATERQRRYRERLKESS